MIAKSLLALLPLVGYVRAHGCPWHPSMYGFNVTASNSPQYGSRDNRPQAPLKGLPFSEWWMHGHLDQPPHPSDVFEFPAGGKATLELACDKDATSYWPSGPGGNRQNGNDPCPGPPSQRIHSNGINDLGGCGIAIAYKSNVNDVKPEDMVVFSVNHQCIWDRFTDFQVPANMPPCPDGKCICAWLWQHQGDAGGDEMYMNGFQCTITGATHNTPIPKGKVPVKCADDKSKCVKGAKVPMYWDQAEGNNMFNDIRDPPMYLDSYGFPDGAQNDLWDGVAEAKGTTTASTSTHVATSASTSVVVATSSSAAVVTSSSAAAQAPAPKTHTSSASSLAPVTTSSSGPQKAQAATPATSSPATTTKGGQGHRTCRPKQNKRSSREVYDAAIQKHRRSRRAF